METFELQNNEFIELNKLLKIMRLVDSGGASNTCIENGEVIVNGTVELRKRNKLRKGDKIVFRKQTVVIA